jgi:regulator of protease activity HflC (stomatin/prohibitin superfamily)
VGDTAFLVFVAAFFGFTGLLLFLSYVSVSQGQEYTVERFGKYVNTLYPGINFIMPLVDRVSHRINMMEQVMDVPSQEVITVDNAMVRVDGVVFFQVMDSARAAYRVENLHSAIENLTTTNIRTVMGSMELDALLSRRDDINNQLMKVVDEATDPWGVKILRVEIKDILPPADLVEAMARQMKAERDKRAYILEAEGKRQASILLAEGEARSKVLEAEGRKESAFLEAASRERLAEAEAKATRAVSEAITNGSAQAINYFIAQKYIEALGKIASAENQKLIMLPLEVSTVLGALNGIGEIVKEAFAKNPEQKRQAVQMETIKAAFQETASLSPVEGIEQGDTEQNEEN